MKAAAEADDAENKVQTRIFGRMREEVTQG
jgi:hypothetical protein